MDSRKKEVLKAIVQFYILSPVPVGSRKISKEYDLGVSSATIRNEMSDLEEMGYLIQPHASAGRIPSDKAYRFYVDEFLKDQIQKLKTVKQKETLEFDLSLGTDEFYTSVADYLAELSGNISYVLAPAKKDTDIKHLDLISMDDNLVLAIIVGNEGIVERSLVHTQHSVDQGELSTIASLLRQELEGLNFDEVTEYKVHLSDDLMKFKPLIEKVLKLAKKVALKVDKANIYTAGLTNILLFEEYQDLDRARQLMAFIEDKDNLLRLIEQQSFQDELIISIGAENDEDTLKSNALISVNYRLEDNIGKIGLIGPMRMDYFDLIRKSFIMSQSISQLFKNGDDLR